KAACPGGAAVAAGQGAGRGRAAGGGTAPDGISVARGAARQGYRWTARDEQGRASGAAQGRAVPGTARGTSEGRAKLRIRHRSMDAQTCAPSHREALRSPIQRGARLAARSEEHTSELQSREN